MSVISEIISEITYIIIFCLGIGFLLLTYDSMVSTNDIVTEDVRTKLTIQEGEGYTGRNVIDGTSMYYDILSSGTDYPVYVNGSAISGAYIQEAINGNATNLLSSFSIDDSYVKTYAQDADGNVTQVMYNRAD